MTTESRLRAIRTDLNISREKLAYLTGGNVCISTIRNVECRYCRITFGKAQLLLSAINSVLAEKQKPEMTLADLEIKLY